MGYDCYRENASNNEDGDGYFRLNIWGMGEVREALWKVGVVNEEPCPPYPKPEDFGLPPDTFEVDDDHPYAVACRAWTDDPVPGDSCGIPVYKLGSNDGWLVRPSEITTGLEYADAHTPGWRDDLDEYATEFVAWLELCAASGGFRVW
jgi:hypothetical protein